MYDVSLQPFHHRQNLLRLLHLTQFLMINFYIELSLIDAVLLPKKVKGYFGSDQVKGQGQGHEEVKNYWTELHEIFRDALPSSKDQSIRFWERSGQRSRSRSRSRKGLKCIFVIMCSVFV